MPEKAIFPPTPAILKACATLDIAIAGLLKARTGLRGYGNFESSIEAMNLLYLAIRQVEGVTTLARRDLVMLPAAQACARAALEISTKAAWMVDSNDPFERELRWLAHLREEERVHERLAKRQHDTDLGRSARESTVFIRKFREAVEGVLPPGKRLPLKHNATVDEMLAALNSEHLYVPYIHLSQFLHGGHAATWLYRQGGLGNKKRHGEFVDVAQWHLPLWVCWTSLLELGGMTLWRIGHQGRSFLTADVTARAKSILDEIRTARSDA